MNFLSLNIRGAGSSTKMEWVRRLKRTHKLQFLAFQETQFTDSSCIQVRNYWDSSTYESAAVDANGRSGGLLCIWNPVLFRRKCTIRSQFFLVIVGTLQGSSEDLIIANVYAPQGQSEKNMLWLNLLRLINTWNGTWILLGDFNDVRTPEERMNSAFCKVGAKKLNEFIAQAGLSEYSMGGRKFTYMTDGGGGGKAQQD